MQDIKIRAWDGDKFWYWQFGWNYFLDKDSDDYIKLTYVKDMIPELYIGIKDKNGKLIYAGDNGKTETSESYFTIIHHHDEDEYGYVYHSGFAAKWEDGTIDVGYKFYETVNGCEIIGTIHENPELLEKQ